MDYHLHSNGQTVGIFPLEELHRRRLRGEVNGADHVWRDGRAQWELLDSVLVANGLPLPTATPPPIPANASPSSSNRTMVWGWVAAGVSALIVFGLFGKSIL